MLRTLLLFIFSLPIVCATAKEFTIAVNERQIYRYVDAQGFWQGQDIELIRAVFKRTPHNFTLIAMPWSRILKSIESGLVDMTLAASVLPEREDYALFTSHIFRHSHYVLFVNKQRLDSFAAIQSLADVATANVLIGALRGAIYSSTYASLLEDEQFLQRMVFIDNDQNLPQLAALGRVDGYIESEIEGRHYLQNWDKKQHQMVPLFRITNNQEASNYLMFSKQTVTMDTVAEFDAALNDLHASGEYLSIVAKYLPNVRH
ncbi:substrate-binding periplasmic protein [Alteromonas flava]|uniref:substrate-binding periplasmic protein n=1 Tax=Alteromonas flava TaxID=2048003 RepID=UPI0013D9E6FE|nr:transporter substrate-binding domain-containing protein [Alteromonas flava]